MAGYVFVLPFAVAKKMAVVLLAERNLIVRRDAGKTVKGYIPDWAGQWGLIGTPVAENESPEAAAERAFKEQASFDLSAASVVTNFVLGNRKLVQLKTADHTQFHVLCIFTTRTALGLVADGANSVILSGQTQSGLLSQTKLFSIGQARSKLGETTPPSNGWKSYLVENYYGGKAPGQLNTEIDTLTAAITNSAKQDNDFLDTALAAT